MSKQSQMGTSKRERFEQSGRFPVRSWAIVAVALVVLVGGGLLAFRLLSKSEEAGGEVLASGGVTYSGTQQMVLLDSPQVEGDTLRIALAEVTEKKLGAFVYSRSTPLPSGYSAFENNGMPLLAYVAPSGRLVVASSLCEPCRSYEFHIEDGELVCNACGTRWDLNTLRGVSGGCLSYPPEELQAEVEGDQVVIERSVLESWTPRA